MPFLNQSEAINLFNHIGDDHNPRKNMHTRGKANKKWTYLNGLILRKNKELIEGHVYFKNKVEIEYTIEKNGQYKITNSQNISAPDAIKKLLSLKKEILNSVKKGHNTGKNIRVKRTPNEYYLVRQDWNLTKTAQEAIKNKDISEKFLKKMANWNLCLIKGKPK